MIVSIHQPNYLPWLGFFDKMSRSDVFVLLDTVQFAKNSFQNRTQIKTRQGPRWLTVPVLTRGRFKQATSEVEVDNKTGWPRKHLRAIETNYGRAPHFGEYASWFKRFYERDWDKLVDLNTTAIKFIAREMAIRTAILMASELNVSGHGTDLLLSICQAVGAGVYLSGPSGREYLSEGVFRKSGIELRYHEFSYPRYPQLFGEFVPNLSVLDVLLNCGSEGFSF